MNSIATKTSIVATKTSIIVTKVEKNYKKNVATHEIMSRQKMEDKGDKPRQVCRDKECCNKQFNQQQISKKEIYCNIFRVCRNTEFSLSCAG